MKLRSDIIWAALLAITAVVAYYFGAEAGRLETEKILEREVQEKKEKLGVLEDKIQQLSEELKSRGIYSYPQANIVSKNDGTNAAALITLNGKDPIQDLRITREIGNSEVLSGEAATTSHLGTLTAHNPVAFEIEPFKEEKAIHLIFRADQNEWHQYIRMRKTPTGEIKTFWIITNGDSKVIDKHIDKGFPADKGKLNFGRLENLDYEDIQMNSEFPI